MWKEILDRKSPRFGRIPARAVATFVLLIGLAAGGCGDPQLDPEAYAREVATITNEFTGTSAEAMREMAAIVGSAAGADDKSAATAATRLRVAAAASAAGVALADLNPPDDAATAHATLIAFFMALQRENEVAARFFTSPTEALKTELALAQERTRTTGSEYERRRAALASELSLPRLGFPATEPGDRPAAALAYRAFIEDLLLAVPEIMRPLDRLETTLAALTGTESNRQLEGIYILAAEELALSREQLATLRGDLIRTIAPAEYAAAHARTEAGLECLALGLAEFESAFRQIGDGQSLTGIATADRALSCYRLEWTELLGELDDLGRE